MARIGILIVNKLEENQHNYTKLAKLIGSSENLFYFFPSYWMRMFPIDFHNFGVETHQPHDSVPRRSILNEVDKGTHLDQVMIETTGSGHSMSQHIVNQLLWVFLCFSPFSPSGIACLRDVFECFWYFHRIDSENGSNGAGPQWEEWQIPFQLFVRQRLGKGLKKWRVVIKHIGITVGILKSRFFSLSSQTIYGIL